MKQLFTLARLLACEETSGVIVQRGGGGLQTGWSGGLWGSVDWYHFLLFRLCEEGETL